MEKEYLRKCITSGMSTRDIAQDCDLSNSNVRYWIKKYNLSQLSPYRKTQNIKFEKIDTKEKAYVLGFILGDGHINENYEVSITVAIRDVEVLEFLSKELNSKVFCNRHINKRNKQFPHASMHKKIPDILKFTGGRLKEDRHYPRIRKDLESYLIQGFFDADGCITWGYRKDRNRIWHKVSFTSQYKLLEGVQKYLYNIGITTVVRPKSNERCYILEFANRSDVMKFYNHLYEDKDFIVLKRKYYKYNALRLELEENGESDRRGRQCRAEPIE